MRFGYIRVAKDEDYSRMDIKLIFSIVLYVRSLLIKNKAYRTAWNGILENLPSDERE